MFRVGVVITHSVDENLEAQWIRRLWDLFLLPTAR